MNKFNIKKISMALVVASFVSGTAFANSDISDSLITKIESAVPTFSELVKQYDANKNETLNVQELVENVELIKVFEVVDANNDNEINNDEYNHYVESIKA